MRIPSYRIIDLCDVIKEVVISIIECSECNLHKELQAPDIHAAKTWFEEGWRGNESGAFCPKCSKQLKLI